MTDTPDDLLFDDDLLVADDALGPSRVNKRRRLVKVADIEACRNVEEVRRVRSEVVAPGSGSEVAPDRSPKVESNFPPPSSASDSSLRTFDDWVVFMERCNAEELGLPSVKFATCHYMDAHVDGPVSTGADGTLQIATAFDFEAQTRFVGRVRPNGSIEIGVRVGGEHVDSSDTVLGLTDGPNRNPETYGSLIVRREPDGSARVEADVHDPLDGGNLPAALLAAGLVRDESYAKKLGDARRLGVDEHRFRLSSVSSVPCDPPEDGVDMTDVWHRRFSLAPGTRITLVLGAVTSHETLPEPGKYRGCVLTLRFVQGSRLECTTSEGKTCVVQMGGLGSHTRAEGHIVNPCPASVMFHGCECPSRDWILNARFESQSSVGVRGTGIYFKGIHRVLVGDQSSMLAGPKRNREPSSYTGRGGGARGACFTCGDPTHWSSQCPHRRVNRAPGRGVSGRRGACFRCGGEGHWSSQCPSRRAS